MQTKIKIFESGISDGIMSRNKTFYPTQISQVDINEMFLKTRIELGKKHGFDGKKIFQASQKNEINKLEYPNGKYTVLTAEHMQKEDFWYENLPTDILILEEKYKNIVVGNQMADCPILIIEDRKLGVTALSHCGAAYINRKLPLQTAEALIKEYKSNPENLYVYIGSNAKKGSYIYDKYPLWATSNEVWEGHIIENNHSYNIDMEGAMIKQLESIGIKNITVSNNDTVTDDIHYSHSASSKGIKSKKGQNFVGFFYK